MTPRFADAMMLRPIEDRPGEFIGNIDADWTIGP